MVDIAKLEEVERGLRPWHNRLDCCAHLEDIRAAHTADEWQQFIKSPAYGAFLRRFIGLDR